MAVWPPRLRCRPRVVGPLTVGAHPVAALVTALVGDEATTAPDIVSTVGAEATAIAREAVSSGRWILPVAFLSTLARRRRLVLVVDQLEELAALPAEERLRFLGLVKAALLAEQRLVVVATVRADLLGRSSLAQQATPSTGRKWSRRWAPRRCGPWSLARSRPRASRSATVSSTRSWRTPSVRTPCRCWVYAAPPLRDGDRRDHHGRRLSSRDGVM